MAGSLRRAAASGSADDVTSSYAVLRTHSLQPVAYRRHVQFCQQWRQKRRGRQTAVIAIVRVCNIDHFIDFGGHALRGAQNGIQNALEFIIGLALHAQRDKENPGLHRIDRIFQNGLHAQSGFLHGNVLRQFRTGSNALDDRVHCFGEIGGIRNGGVH